MEAKKYPHVDLSRFQRMFFNLGLALSLGMVISIFEWKFYDDNNLVQLGSLDTDFNEIIDIPITEQPPPPPPQKQALINVIEIKDMEDIEEEIEINLDIEMTEETIIREVEISVEAPVIEEEADEIFLIVEENPEPIGGYEKFYNYVSSNLHYPPASRRLGIEGKVFVEFVVDIDGSINDVKVIKGIADDCDIEAIRVVSNAPKWKPGKQRGKAVKVRMVIPIVFLIHKS